MPGTCVRLLLPYDRKRSHQRRQHHLHGLTSHQDWLDYFRRKQRRNPTLCACG